MGRWKNSTNVVFVLLAASIFLLLPVAVDDAMAQCTSTFVIPAAQGIFTSIITQIIAVINNLSENMFLGITGDNGFDTVVELTTTAYFSIYGLLFAFGMTQSTFSEVAGRMAKVGVIGMLVPGSALLPSGTDIWYWFDLTVIPFFQNSMGTIVSWVTSVAIGPFAAMGSATAAYCPAGTVATATSATSCIMDTAITYVISPNMLITLMTTTLTGPYGPFIGIIMTLATITFIKTMTHALWVYATALIMQALLFGMAPIFLSCLLFSRTRHLFDGWLNELVKTLVKPVLLFTFLSFFVLLIQSCVVLILSYNICWAQLPVIFSGTPLGGFFWRFVLTQVLANTPSNGVSWGPYGPVLGGLLAGEPIFPIPVVLVLTYSLLTALNEHFVAVCERISDEFAKATSDIRAQAEGVGKFLVSRGFSGGGFGSGAFGGDGGAGGGESGGLFKAFEGLFGGGDDEAATGTLAAGRVRPGNPWQPPGVGGQVASGDADPSDWRSSFAPGVGVRKDDLG